MHLRLGCGGQTLCRDICPVFPAVIRLDQLKSPVDRIAHRNTVIPIPKSHAIEKPFWIFVSELQRPTFTAVVSLVNARVIARAGGKQVNQIRTECFYIPEI